MATSKKEGKPKAIKPKEISVKRNLKEKLQEEYSSEAIFALCGPIGSPIHDVGLRLQNILIEKYGYTDCEIIRIGQEIPKLGLKVGGKIKWGNLNRFDEIKNKIIVANNLRKEFGNSILAEYAIEQIHNHRKAKGSYIEERGETKSIVTLDEKAGLQKMPESPKIETPRKVAYIIDSIKNQEELDILRLVYRDLLYFIGVFAPLKDRNINLRRELADSTGSQVAELIDKDTGKELNNGPTVDDTFPHADFFLRIAKQNNTQIEGKLERFLDLIFNKKIVSPTAKETAMYIASSSAKNSACLSRQVGAALTDEKGEIISVGWNDVPKFGGDLYKSALKTYGSLSHIDGRCMNIEGGMCFNDLEKNQMVDMIYKELDDKKLLISGNNALINEIRATFPVDIQPQLKDIKTIIKHVLRNSKIKSLVEFSRSIHAEMHAIIMGCQSSGERVIKGKLFITTYPCHNCARHIIVAGIKDVYYIEPYRKSLTISLHRDSITEDEDDKTKVRILMFEGVGPNRYLELFEMKEQRKGS